mmetsp:Transcript_16489/g.27998  ORF Transcript_16489/g.27998 Transcript_16489/m.27998 type:complete len:209 (-) Transcript_16489:961-1587(-)
MGTDRETIKKVRKSIKQGKDLPVEQANVPVEITDLETLMKLDGILNSREGGDQEGLDFGEGQSSDFDPMEDHFIMTKENLKEMKRAKKMVETRPVKTLTCNRCSSLRNQNKLIELKSGLKRTKNNKMRPGQAVPLAEHVANFNRGEIIRNIFKQIYSQSIIIYVIDIVNFEGSQIEEIYDLVNNHRHRLILVVNKIDALPKGFTVSNL